MLTIVFADLLCACLWFGWQTIERRSDTRSATKVVNSSHEVGAPLGILTTDHRDNWSNAYIELCKGTESKLGFRNVVN